MQYVERKIPKISKGHVLVKNKFAGLNFIDTYLRRGLYPKPVPFILGVEGAGEIVEVGDECAGLQAGQSVSFYGSGSYAEYSLIPATEVNRIPPGIGMDVGVYLTLQGLTAHYLACSTFALRPGSKCVVLAAGGGVGRLLVQIAKIKGAEVLAVTSPGKVSAVESLGPDRICGYEEFLGEAEAMGKADVVYDSVGKDTWLRSMKSLRPRGMLVLYGNASGPAPPIDPLSLAANGSIYITRPTLAHYILTPEEKTSRFDDLYSWYTSGKLQLNFDNTFPLSQVKDVHTYLESGKSTGKILLDVGL